MVWVRIAIAIVLLALVFVGIARRQRRVRAALLDQPTLRRRIADTGSGFKRIQARLDPLGFRFIGDYDVCSRDGKRLHRFMVAWNDAESTLAMRGRQVFAFYTTLDGGETDPSTIVVQTSALDVERTHSHYVVQTVRGVKHGSEQALLAVHREAIALLEMEGWDERRNHRDPVEFARSVLVEAAEAHASGAPRRSLSAGSGAHRTYANGRAQVGRGIRPLDAAELDVGYHDAIGDVEA